MFPAFFNPRWVRLIRDTVEEIGADLVLCRDLPLAPTALYVARKQGIPVVLDMAENYPAMIRDLWTTRARGAWDWLVRNPRLVEWVETWTLPRVDHILVVVEESRDRLERQGVPAGRITVVSNTPEKARVDRFSRSRTGPGRAKDGLSLVYLGLMERARGVGTALDALRIARDGGLAATLTLIGEGIHLEDFRAQGKELGLVHEGAVDFTGYLPHDRALEVVARADVGLVPHHANESWNTTIPNKLFDYMAAGLAVVASDTTPVERVLLETGSGRVFRDRDAGHLAKVLEGLAREDVAKQMGEAGRRAIVDRYNWEADTRRLLDALGRVSEPVAGAEDRATGDRAREGADR